MGWTDKAVRRYVRDAGPLLDDLNDLQRCDCTTRNQNRARALARRMDELEARIAALREQEQLDSIQPPLDGRQVMEFLGVPPGRVVGEALDYLLEARLDEGPIDEADAYPRLADWAPTRHPGARRRSVARSIEQVSLEGSLRRLSATCSWWCSREAEQPARVAAEDRVLVVVGERRLDDLQRAGD